MNGQISEKNFSRGADVMAARGTNRGRGRGRGTSAPHLGSESDDHRCCRSDGKQWRCSDQAMPGRRLCEKHYLQQQKRSKAAASRGGHAGKKGRKPLAVSHDSDESSESAEISQPPAVEGKNRGGKRMDKDEEQEFGDSDSENRSEWSEESMKASIEDDVRKNKVVVYEDSSARVSSEAARKKD